MMRELFGNTGPPDRLLDLADCELELGHVTEGAVDHVLGRPLDACPYDRDDAARFQSWRRGWLDACRWRDLREASSFDDDWTTDNTDLMEG